MLLYMQVLFHIYRSSFVSFSIFTGLHASSFPYLQVFICVLFHIYRSSFVSLSIFTGLHLCPFPYLQIFICVPFHIYRSSMVSVRPKSWYNLTSSCLQKITRISSLGCCIVVVCSIDNSLNKFVYATISSSFFIFYMLKCCGLSTFSVLK